jgi:hypothetical protein
VTSEAIKLMYGKDAMMFKNGAILIYNNNTIKIITRRVDFVIKGVDKLEEAVEKDDFLRLAYIYDGYNANKVLNIRYGHSVDKLCNIWNGGLLTAICGFNNKCIEIMDSSFETMFMIRKKNKIGDIINNIDVIKFELESGLKINIAVKILYMNNKEIEEHISLERVSFGNYTITDSDWEVIG